MKKLKFVCNYLFSDLSRYAVEENHQLVDSSVGPAMVKRTELVDKASQVNEWAAQFIQGRPQATEGKSVEDLEALGIVGLYREVDTDATS